jgi:uncharacterized protein (DUF2141 family)
MGQTSSAGGISRSATFGIATLLLTTALMAQEANQNALLTVEVSGFADSDGQATIMLLDSKQAFEAMDMRHERDKWKKDYRDLADVKIRGAGKSRSVKHEFDDLKPGQYVVFVIHDRNLNGKLDANPIGVPREPFGMSNNFRPQLLPVPQRPSWEKLTFAVKPGENRIAINVQN